MIFDIIIVAAGISNLWVYKNKTMGGRKLNLISGWFCIVVGSFSLLQELFSLDIEINGTI